MKFEPKFNFFITWPILLIYLKVFRQPTKVLNYYKCLQIWYAYDVMPYCRPIYIVLVYFIQFRRLRYMFT